MPNKLISLLRTFADSELESLRGILRNPAATRNLLDIVETTISLRRAEEKLQGSVVRVTGESQKTKQKRDSAVKQESFSGPNVSQSWAPSRFRSFLLQTITNRKKFPSNKEVIGAINEAFGTDFDYRTYQKAGRAQIVDRLCSYISNLPDDERRHRIKLFLQGNTMRSVGNDTYSELFRALTDAK